MKLITPVSRHSGGTSYAVWEYDTDKPRNPSAADMRAQYAVKGFVGSYRTMAEAKLAATA